MQTNSINRVTLLGYIDAAPYTLGDKTTHAQTILSVITRDFGEEPTGFTYIRCRRHTVTVTDFMAREYIDLHLKKRDGVFIEGQLEYVRYGSCHQCPHSKCPHTISAEIVITPFYGNIRRLDEAPVPKLEQGFVKDGTAFNINHSNTHYN